jgi:hypothetical protein
MTRRRTHLLILLVLLSGAAAAIAVARLSDSRGAALAARGDLDLARRQLDDLHRWRSGGGDAGGDARLATTLGATDASQLNRLLREAAAHAGAAERIVSIEPGPPSRLAGDYVQLPVFLRLEAISMRELTMFLHQLATIDPSTRAQSIDLSAAGNATTGGGAGPELWDADVTIACVNYQPEGRQ